MTTRDALLAAVAAAPDDDTPRLVYADFLDETGEPADAARADLIRTQVAAARLPADDPARDGLDARAGELWERHQADWFPGVSPRKLPHPERGFITHWGCYSADEFAELPAVFAREPITDLTISLRDPADLAGVVGRPELARVRELNLWPGEADDATLVPFFSSPHLSGLRKLWVMGNRGRTWGRMAQAVRVLATRPQYATLRQLDIEHAVVGEAGAAALAASTTLRGLTTLGLGGAEVGMAGVRVLLASPVLASITSLSLGGQARTAADGETLAEALAGSPHLGRLESLGLDHTAFTNAAAVRLARARWPGLRRLMVLPYPVNHSDEQTGLPTLTTRGVEALLAGGLLANLEDLDLSGHPFGDAGAEALARDGRLGRLRRLTLMRAGLSAEGLRAVCGAYSRQLELLQLAYNQLGDAGAAVIAGAVWPRMTPGDGADHEQRGLLMAVCGIGEAGARALARSTTIPRDIPNLFSGQSGISPKVEAALRARYPRATISL